MAGYALWSLDLDNVFDSNINSVIVHLDNFIAFLAKGLFDCVLDGCDCLFLGKDAGNKEEGSLHDHVDTTAKPYSLSKLDGINNIELDLFINNLALYKRRKMFPYLCFAEVCGQQKGAAFLKIGKHVILVKEGEVMAGNEAGFVDQVGSDNLVLAKAQMADGQGTGFL